MNNLFTIRFIGAIAVLGLASCSTNYSALRGESDDLYFMASDAKMATEFAVENNNRENFKQLEQINAEEYIPENFSAKNVNPEYLAKYQSDTSSEEGTVYFDESTGETVASEGGDINIYNNFRGNSGRNNFNSWNMNPWMMSSMYMGGFSPWGFSPWGMGSFYDPFWGSGYGFRPGFNLSLGLGFGFGSRLGWGLGSPWRYGYGMGYYDPFYSPYYAYGRPIIIVPGGSENQRQIVRGARPSRSVLATSRTRDNLASPSTSRAAARREAVSRTSTPSSRANARTDFSRSQNDYYNANARNAAASAAPSRRNVNSPAMSRTNSGSSRDAYTAPSRTLRTTAPSVEGGASTPARSRYAAPSRQSSPSYNRSATPQYNRTTTPSNNTRSTYSTPSRSSSPSFSAPSRSSGSSGGAVRSSGGSSRRGN
jgi:hypothetical protein